MRDRVVRGVGALAVAALSASAWGATLRLDESRLPAPIGRQDAGGGETGSKTLQAVIMEVKGPNARWRPGPEVDFKPAQVNDILDEGAEIDVGLRSSIALRVGMNATMIVDRLTMVTLAHMAQEGDTLRTHVALQRGNADFKVDRVGLNNDFQVLTPSTTLSVAGTILEVSHGGFDGTGVEGVPGNAMRAIEVRYFTQGASAVVSGQGKSTESQPNPVTNALFDTIGPPPTLTVADADQAAVLATLGFSPDQTATNAQTVNNASTGQGQVFMQAGITQPPQGGSGGVLPPPPGGGPLPPGQPPTTGAPPGQPGSPGSGAPGSGGGGSGGGGGGGGGGEHNPPGGGGTITPPGGENPAPPTVPPAPTGPGGTVGGEMDMPIPAPVLTPSVAPMGQEGRLSIGAGGDGERPVWGRDMGQLPPGVAPTGGGFEQMVRGFSAVPGVSARPGAAGGAGSAGAGAGAKGGAGGAGVAGPARGAGAP